MLISYLWVSWKLDSRVVISVGRVFHVSVNHTYLTDKRVADNSKIRVDNSPKLFSTIDCYWNKFLTDDCLKTLGWMSKDCSDDCTAIPYREVHRNTGKALYTVTDLANSCVKYK